MSTQSADKKFCAGPVAPLSLTQEMVDRFYWRTQRHIHLVRQNLLLLEGYMGLDKTLLSERGDHHDQSKFGRLERTGYIWLTWMYHCRDRGVKFEFSDGVMTEINRAMEHHRAHNRHHPEYHPSPDSMDIIDIVEMVCDWAAISQETSQMKGSCFGWAQRNVREKWRFSEDQFQLIFRTIEEIDSRVGSSR